MAHENETFEDFMLRREAISNDYINGRPDGVLSILTTDNPATFFPPNGDRIQGATQVHAANEKGAEAFDEGSAGHFEIMDSGSSGDLGFWTGVQHAEMRMKGKDKAISMQLRTTEIFRRRDGKWTLVHRHADMVNSGDS
jgi:ketosteroid isomerase-like protein